MRCTSRHFDLIGRLERYGLSPSQINIAVGVRNGLSNREIARRFHIEEQTVKDHLQEVFRKTGVKSRTALIAKVLGTDGEAALERGR